MKYLFCFLLCPSFSTIVQGQDEQTISFYKRLATLWNVHLRWTPIPKKDDSTGIVYLQVIADDQFFKENADDVPLYAGNYMTLFYASIMKRKHSGFDSLYLDFSKISDPTTVIYHYDASFRDLDTMEIATPIRIKAFLFLCSGYFNSIIEDKHLVATFKYNGLITEQVHQILYYRSLLIMYLLKNFVIDNVRKYKEFVFVWVDNKHNQLIEGFRPRSKFFRKSFKRDHKMFN